MTFNKDGIGFRMVIWLFNEGACEKCREMISIYRADQVPRRPHPNCKCKIFYADDGSAVDESMVEYKDIKKDVNNFKTINGWLKMYKKPKVYNIGRVVEIPSEVDKSRWAMLEGQEDINFWGRKILEDKGLNVVAIIGSQGELTNEEGRYWVAVGPKVMNPNHKESDPVVTENMKYGKTLDVVVMDKNKNEYYIPCIVGDIKAHTYPNGIYQTGYGYPGEEDYPMNNDGSIIEFMGSASIAGLTEYEIVRIIVYDVVFNVVN